MSRFIESIGIPLFLNNAIRRFYRTLFVKGKDFRHSQIVKKGSKYYDDFEKIETVIKKFKIVENRMK